MQEVEKQTDHVDILLANAGATWGAPFDKHPVDAFNKVMNLNVNSVFNCVQKYVLRVKPREVQNIDGIVDSLRCSGRTRPKKTHPVSSPPPP